MRAEVITFKRARRMRRTMSPPEVALWEQLRGRRLAHLRFRRQHPIGPYILDCVGAKLCVEVDGGSHDFAAQATHDHRRMGWLAERGIRVLRVTTPDVLDPVRLNDVLRGIERAAAPSTGLAGPPPP